jgi:hypothetical protein
MKFLTKFPPLNSKKFIFLDEFTDDGSEDLPENPKEAAKLILDTFKAFGTLNKSEYSDLIAFIDSVNLDQTEGLEGYIKAAPPRIVVDFLSENPGTQNMTTILESARDVWQNDIVYGDEEDQKKPFSTSFYTQLALSSYAKKYRSTETLKETKDLALNYLAYAKERSIFLTTEEYEALKCLVERADMQQEFIDEDHAIPDSVVVDFLSEEPALILLNPIITRSRIGLAQSPNAAFNEMFKIVLAYQQGLINNEA